MMHRPVHGQRLVTLFFAGWVLFSFPLMTAFDRDATLFGVPLLIIWLFGAWLALIATTAWMVRRTGG
jgi:hypothetical protein